MSPAAEEGTPRRWWGDAVRQRPKPSGKGAGRRNEAPLLSAKPCSPPDPRLTPSPWGCCLVPRDGDYFAFM